MHHAIDVIHFADVLDPQYEDEVSGCTATVAIISGKKIYVVSCGAYFMPLYILTKKG